MNDFHLSLYLGLSRVLRVRLKVLIASMLLFPSLKSLMAVRWQGQLWKFLDLKK